VEEAHKPHLLLFLDSNEFKFRVYLVNPTEKNYNSFIVQTGTYFFIDDKPVQSNSVKKEFGEFNLNSSILIDESDIGELDFTIWYRIELFQKDLENIEKLNFTILPNTRLDNTIIKSNLN